MDKISICFAFIFTSFFALGQSKYVISGIVIDDAKKPVEFANISLLNAKDSSFVKSIFTDTDGKFELSKIAQAAYILSVTQLGFKDYSTNIELVENKEIVITLLNENSLATVTVTSKTPYIQKKIDRTIVNVDALISNAGSNAYEALERAPGISTDNDGNIKLKGRAGVAIYIDDKPTYLSGQELENYLKSLPAGTIKHIEIMTNPPAKYEAAGNAGIINIVTKRNKLAGFFGNASATAQRSRFWRNSGSLNLNYNKNKISIYANINGSTRKSYQDLNINRYYKNENGQPLTSFFQNSYIVKSSENSNTKIGLDYYANNSTTIGCSIKTLTNPGSNNTQNKATINDDKSILLRNVNADNNQINSFGNATYNAYIKKLIDTLGSYLTFDLDYVTYNSGSNQLFKNTFINPDKTITYKDQINGALPSTIKIYTAKTDYTKPLNTSTTFSAGLKSAFTKTENEAIYSTTIDAETNPDYDLSNKFLYDEWIHAAYVNLNSKLGPVEVQVGLRGENTSLQGNQLGNILKPGKKFDRKYTKPFPTLFLSWNADSAAYHNISFSFGKRIDRPFFQDLNPFISPLDKFTFYTGNPNLLPTYSYNYSLTHSYKGQVNTSLSYSKTTDGITETLEIVDGIYYSRPNNISTGETYSISVETGLQISSWLSLNSYCELSYLKYKSKLYTEDLNSAGTFYFLSGQTLFNLGKGWNADIRGDYQSDVVSAQLVILNFGVLNAGVSKKLFNDAASIKLAINDILHTRRGSGIINNLRNTDANWNSVIDTRVASLTFSYRFGKSASNKNKYKAGGSESEQSRVKG